MESEKVTITLAPVDLGKVDLVVSQGLYSSRADLIRSAIRRLLDEHERLVSEAATREEFTVGVVSYDRSGLEALRSRGERLRLRVLGYLRLADDVTADLADEVVEQARVFGVFRAPADVTARLGAKIVRGPSGGGM